jgi:hypothetical protein
MLIGVESEEPMSETPAPYGDYPQPIIARVDTLERQLAQVIDMQSQNANAVIALVNAIDRMRTRGDDRFMAVESRLVAMENQLAALNRSNQLIAELIATRLPPKASE